MKKYKYLGPSSVKLANLCIEEAGWTFYGDTDLDQEFTEIWIGIARRAMSPLGLVSTNIKNYRDFDYENQ